MHWSDESVGNHVSFALQGSRCKKRNENNQRTQLSEFLYQNTIKNRDYQNAKPAIFILKFLKGMDEIYSSTYDDYEWDDV